MRSEISHLKKTLVGLCSITKVISEITFDLRVMALCSAVNT